MNKGRSITRLDFIGACSAPGCHAPSTYLARYNRCMGKCEDRLVERQYCTSHAERYSRIHKLNYNFAADKAREQRWMGGGGEH